MGPLLSADATALALAGLATATSGVTFAVADVVYAADESLLPPVWAGLQIALAGVPISVAGASTIMLSLERDGDLVAEGVLFTGIGCWFLSHGAMSLAGYEPKPRARPRGVGSQRSARWLAVPVRGGGVVAVGGEF